MLLMLRILLISQRNDQHHSNVSLIHLASIAEEYANDMRRQNKSRHLLYLYSSVSEESANDTRRQ